MLPDVYIRFRGGNIRQCGACHGRAGRESFHGAAALAEFQLIMVLEAAANGIDTAIVTFNKRDFGVVNNIYLRSDVSECDGTYQNPFRLQLHG
jgi:hypothetical protein